MKNYNKQIIQLLTKTGWSQSQLAREIGVTFATVNRWINSHARPHPTQLRQIDRLFRDIIGITPLPRSEISSIIKAVTAKKKQFSAIDSLLQIKEIAEEFFLELTYNSDAIEGSTLNRKETEAIIFDKATIKDKSLTEHLEATNHTVILKKIFNGKYNRPITERLIKELHRVLMQGIRDDAGEYAKYQRGIRELDLTLPHPDDIPEEMRFFCHKINDYKGHPIEHIAKMHVDFEAIHPFGDGNGRVGRLIMIIQLLNKGFAPSLITVNRKAFYYEFLEYAQKKSETHFVKFIAESIIKGYELIEKYAR